MRVRQFVTAVSLAMALLATGCASGSDAPTSSATESVPNQGEQEQSAGDDSPAADSTTDDLPADDNTADEPAPAIVRTDDEETRNDAFVSPIFEAVGFDPNDQQAAQDQYTRDAEELVRQCMADAGFDYVPSVPSVAPATRQLWELNAAISAEQFAAEYGLGISTLLELNFADEGVLGFVEFLLGPPPTEPRSEGEQAAYEIALSGETVVGLSPEEVQEQSDNVFGSADGSCRAYGYETADNEIGEKFDGLFTLLGDEFDSLQDEVENDPRIREITGEWQRCMAEFGYSYEDSDEIFNEFSEEADSLGDRFVSSPEALQIFAAAQEADLASLDADGRYNFLEQAGAFRGFALTPDLQVELDALIERELAVAVRNLECADIDTFIEVQVEYEQGFVEEHAAQLELIAAGEA